MLFHSWQFLVFFPAVSLLFRLTSKASRVWLLLVAGAMFYMAFIPSYLAILLAMIVIDYLAGLAIERSTDPVRRKTALAASVCVNLGILFTFKYLDLAMSSLATAAQWMGWGFVWKAQDWILPLGLSFHTFQAIAYTVEVYSGRFTAERSFPRYALYILFYPQLVAGPIERPQSLLAQFRDWRGVVDGDIVSGLRLMAWGLFKKVVVADRIAPVVDMVFSEPGNCTGIQVIAAALLFLMQIYCDFSGYCDIARGAARTMAIDLVNNFRAPFNSVSIREFWRRWNVSLAEWLRDYVFYPVGGGGRKRAAPIKGTLIVFLASGIWHGANWTFVTWGLLNGVYCCVEALVSPGRAPKPEGWRLFGRQALLYVLVAFSMILSRATSLATSATLLGQLRTGWSLGALRAQMSEIGLHATRLCTLFAGISIVLCVEGDRLGPWLRELVLPRAAVRWTCYYALLAAILMYLDSGQRFIYFQF